MNSRQTRREWLKVAVGFGLASASRLPLARAAEPPQQTEGRTILLVDDRDVLYRSGTERVLHPATRHPANPLVVEDRPWETAIGWTSIHRDPRSGKYQLWYQAYAGKRAGQKTHECVVCYAESADGIRFVKPDLGLFSYKDEKKTNIVLLGNGGYGDRYCNSVIVDAHETDPARRYKMAYYDWSVADGREWAGLHVAFSPDGIHWTKHPGPLTRTAYGGRGLQPPFSGEDVYREQKLPDGRVRKSWLIPFSMSDALDVFYDERLKCYVGYGKLWLQAPDGGLAWKHAMGRIESRDFLSWSKPELVLMPDELDPPDLEFHTTPVFPYGDCYFCLNQILVRAKGEPIDIEMMLSRDGLKWERPFRGTRFLPLSEGRRFDSGSIFTNATPIVLPDEIRFYYGAYCGSAIGGGTDISGDGRPSGVGLATIPRDRFAGIRPVARSAQRTLKRPLEHVGQVTLKPLDLTGCRAITLNADAREGSIRVELLNENGFRVRGFSAADAVPVTGDSLRHAAGWKTAKLAQLLPGRYLLRLHLNRAEVFAVTIT